MSDKHKYYPGSTTLRRKAAELAGEIEPRPQNIASALVAGINACQPTQQSQKQAPQLSVEQKQQILGLTNQLINQLQFEDRLQNMCERLGYKQPEAKQQTEQAPTLNHRARVEAAADPVFAKRLQRIARATGFRAA